MKHSKIFQLCSNLIPNNRRSFATGSSGRDSLRTIAPYLSTVPSPNPSPLEKEILNDFPKICNTPSTESPTNFPKPIDTKPLFKTAIKMLSNDLKIGTASKFDEFCTIRVAINADGRFEKAYPSGVCHFPGKLVFNTTKSFQSLEETTVFLEKNGDKVDCRSTKDATIYAASCHNSDVEQMYQFIADAVLQPNFADQEIAQAREIIPSSFVETVNVKLEPKKILHDWIRQAADQEITLMSPKICQNYGKIVKNELEWAKIQLESLLMSLEQWLISFEDVARQLLAYRRRKPPMEYVKEIKKASIKDLSSKASVVGYGYRCWKISNYKSQRRFYCSSTEMEVIYKLTNTMEAYAKTMAENTKTMAENAKIIGENAKIIRNNQKKIRELMETVMKQTLDLNLLRMQLKAATTDLLFIQGKLLPHSLIELFEDDYIVSELDRHRVALGLNFKKSTDPTDPLMNYKRMGRFEKWSSFLKINENRVVQQLQNVAIENVPYVIMQLYERLSSSVHQAATVRPYGIEINSQHFTSEELQILDIIGEASPVYYHII